MSVTHNSSDYNYLFKIVVAGSSGAGKSSLLLRYIEDTFSTHFIATIGVDFRIKTEDIDGCRVKLQMWDTAGQERFRVIALNFYRNAHALVVVFDVTDQQSFKEAEGWVSEAKRYAPADCKALLVGNKAEDERSRQVDHTAPQVLAQRYGMQYLETSAKTGENVDQAFLSLASEILSYRREQNGGFDPDPHSVGGMSRNNVVLGQRTEVVDSWGCYGQRTCSTL